MWALIQFNKYNENTEFCNMHHIITVLTWKIQIIQTFSLLILAVDLFDTEMIHRSIEPFLFLSNLLVLLLYYIYCFV